MKAVHLCYKLVKMCEAFSQEYQKQFALTEIIFGGTLKKNMFYGLVFCHKCTSVHHNYIEIDIISHFEAK